ncbi:MAG TPA: HAMP domain-containing sensor histidine kinase [Candidatus Saccharimonadales bacterium]|nr:HAMP domain-containing sensor histidine kinase [Candidatus Saccharimonadales bacterium]
MSGPIKDKEVERYELERFAELGRLSASLLHEISNPLAVALLHLDQVGDQTSAGIKHVRRNLIRLSRYVNAARGQLGSAPNTKSFYVDAQISDIRRLALPLAKSSFVRLKINKPPHIRLLGDPLQFQQVLMNLIVNAIESYPPSLAQSAKRQVIVEFDVTVNNLIIDVKDKGSGINNKQIKQIFEPFYTTKARDRQSLGIGLVIVRTYVEKNFKGSITVSSSLTSGTCFRIKFPLM